MCVIIVKPVDKQVEFKTLRQANKANPHGWGVLAKTPEGMVVTKGWSGTKLCEAYAKYKQYEQVIHCRIGTCGILDERNIHPFAVDDASTTYLFHNGGMLNVNRHNPDFNDTWHFARLIQKPVEKYPDLLENPEFYKYLQEFAGGSHKFVIVTAGKTVIVNEGLGRWVNGCWHSNMSALQCRAQVKPRWQKQINNNLRYFNNLTPLNTDVPHLIDDWTPDSGPWYDGLTNIEQDFVHKTIVANHSQVDGYERYIETIKNARDEVFRLRMQAATETNMVSPTQLPLVALRSAGRRNRFKRGNRPTKTSAIVPVEARIVYGD